jgi:hypothetical protein
LVQKLYEAAKVIFGNPIVGGAGSLVRQSIHSPDYVPGVSGWSINKDGTAEFNSTLIRGDLRVVGANGSEVWIHEVDSSAQIDVYVPSPDPLVNPGYIVGSLPFPTGPQLEIVGPSYGAAPPLDPAIIELRKNLTTGDSVISITADQLDLRPTVAGGAQCTITHDAIVLDSDIVNVAEDLRSTVTPYATTGPWVGMRDGAFFEMNGSNSPVTTQSFYKDALITTASGSYVADPGFPTEGLAFNRPASGKVVIDWAALLTHTTTAFSLVSFEIRVGSTIGSGTLAFTAIDDRTIEHAGTSSATASSFFVAELPGSSTTVFNIRLMYRTNAATASFARRRLRVTPVLY